MWSYLPWWMVLVLVARPLLTLLFVVFAGVVQGRTTGSYPTLGEWCHALASLHPTTTSPRYRRDSAILSSTATDRPSRTRDR